MATTPNHRPVQSTTSRAGRRGPGRPQISRRTLRGPILPGVAFIVGLGIVVLITMPILAGFLAGPAASAAPTAAGWLTASIAGDGAIAGIAVGPTGPVAFGSAIWQTTDGTAWEQTTLPTPGPSSLVTLAFVGKTAVGVDEGGGAWRSTDLTTWQPTWTDGGADGARVATSGSVFVITTPSTQGLAWTSTDGTKWQQVAGPNDTLLAYGRGSGTRAYAVAGAAIWRTADGKKWSKLALSSDGQSQAIMGTVAGDLALAGGCGDGSAGSSYAWAAVASGAVKGLSFGDSPGCVKAFGGVKGAWLAGGATDAGPAAWSSADGITGAAMAPDSLALLATAPAGASPADAPSADPSASGVAATAIVGIGQLADGTVVAVARNAAANMNATWYLSPSK